MPVVINSKTHAQFCRQLKGWREHLELTQTELAKKLGISPSVVSQLESGRRAPTLDTVDRVADKMGISVERLLFLPPGEI